jgi:hypothetical protein
VLLLAAKQGPLRSEAVRVASFSLQFCRFIIGHLPARRPSRYYGFPDKAFGRAMTDLTVEAIRTPDGYDFLRSDGLHFFLLSKPDGQAVLHLGRRTARPPAVGLVDFEPGLFESRSSAPMDTGLST